MSNHNFDAHKGEHIPANIPAEASKPNTGKNPVQFPLVMLPGGFAVDAKFMDVIRLLALDHIPLLKPDAEYEAEQIVGADYWEMLTKHETQLAGRCMAHLAKIGVLPLVDRGRGGNNHKRYALK